jgi:hypothetical protein
MPIDISRLIFEQILRIDPALLYRYATIQDQLLYLIFIPHVILLLFLWSFGYWIAGRGHPGIRILISLAGYIYLVWAGWYGTLLVPIIIAWFPLLLLAMFAFFIISRVLHPLTISGMTGVLRAMITRATAGPLERRRLEKEIRYLKTELESVEKLYEDAKAKGMSEAVKEYEKTIKFLQEEIMKRKLALAQRGV